MIGRTRPYAYGALLFFHVMTSTWFNIGIFPLLMPLGAMLFFPPSLRGERLRWLPVLADLCGLLPLPVHVETDPAFGPAGAFAAELCAFRRHRAGGGSREELLAHKRRMLDLAPGLREFVRRL